jgi:hypothetical protein
MGRLWDAIENTIDKKLVWSEFDRTPFNFLPEGELDQILQEFSKREEYGGNPHHVVAALLGISPREMTQEEQDVVNFILHSSVLQALQTLSGDGAFQARADTRY